jgi:hypothetical protein
MKKINLLWTNDNPDTFLRMIAMYALNSKLRNWWENVNLIIWGPSAKLCSENTMIQTEIKELLSAGVSIEACKDCADSYNVTDKLESFGITVRYMSEPLTNYIQNNEQVLTF